MNDQQLQIFLSVAACRNFTAAADQLFLSQSIISYHIRALEKELGFSLFDRTTHSVSLTPAGESLYRSLRELNIRYQEALENAKRIAIQDDSSLRVCFTRPTSPAMMGQFLSFLYQIPCLERLEVIRRSYDDILQPLLQNTAHILFSSPRFFRNEPGLRMRHFCRIWTACLLPPAHPLAAKSAVSLGDLSGEKLLLPDCRNIRTDYGELYNHLRSLSDGMPEIDAMPLGFEQVQELTLAGRGIMPVYTLDSRRHENPDGLISIPILDIPPGDMAILWRDGYLSAPGEELVTGSQDMLFHAPTGP